MKSIPLATADRRLGAPTNWNHETDGICHTLDIWDQDGFMISGWRPTESELVKLNAGEPYGVRMIMPDKYWIKRTSVRRFLFWYRWEFAFHTDHMVLGGFQSSDEAHSAARACGFRWAGGL